MTLADLRQEEYRQKRWTEVTFDEPRHKPKWQPQPEPVPSSPQAKPEPSSLEEGMPKLCAAPGCTERLGKGRKVYHSDECFDATRAQERRHTAMMRRAVKEFYGLGLLDQELVLGALTSAQERRLYFDGLAELVKENRAKTSDYKGWGIRADSDTVWCLIDDELRHRLPLDITPEDSVGLTIVDDEVAEAAASGFAPDVDKSQDDLLRLAS